MERIPVCLFSTWSRSYLSIEGTQAGMVYAVAEGEDSGSIYRPGRYPSWLLLLIRMHGNEMKESIDLKRVVWSCVSSWLICQHWTGRGIQWKFLPTTLAFTTFRIRSHVVLCFTLYESAKREWHAFAGSKLGICLYCMNQQLMMHVLGKTKFLQLPHWSSRKSVNQRLILSLLSTLWAGASTNLVSVRVRRRHQQTIYTMNTHCTL